MAVIDKSEYACQVEIFQQAAQLQAKYPELALLNASLNGLKLPIGLAVKAKRSGMRKGMPDLHLPVPRGGYYGLFIELKAGRNQATREQAAWIEALNSMGYYACVRWGVRDTVDVIIDYLEGRIKGREAA